MSDITFDQDIYGDLNHDYVDSIPSKEGEQEDIAPPSKKPLSNFSAPKEAFKQVLDMDIENDTDPLHSKHRITDREDSYKARRLNRQLSPDRKDAFSKNGSGEARSFSEVMRETELEREKQKTLRQIHQIQMEENQQAIQEMRNKEEKSETSIKSEWEEEAKAPKKRSRWDQTPSTQAETAPTPVRRSRWDQTPVGKTGQFDATPVGNIGMATPLPGSMTPQQVKQARIEKELDYRNRYLSDQELDSILPTVGYKVLEPPPNYAPIRTPSRKLAETPAPMEGIEQGFMMQDEQSQMQAQEALDIIPEIPGVDGLQFFKSEDMQYFGKLMDNKKEDDMTAEDMRERKIMRLLLKIKNGSPPVRKVALRLLQEKARDFGAAPLFNQILPLLMSPTLEDQERHLLVILLFFLFFLI